MIEGQFQRADLAGGRDSADLRQFRWTDLVARLAATRDLRDEIAQSEGGFGAFADLRREGYNKGECAINHVASNDGKSDPVNMPDNAGDAAHANERRND